MAAAAAWGSRPEQIIDHGRLRSSTDTSKRFRISRARRPSLNAIKTVWTAIGSSSDNELLQLIAAAARDPVHTAKT